MKKIIYGLMAFSPVLALAQTADQSLSGVQTLVKSIGKIVGLVVPILFAIAIVYFFWGIITYIKAAGDPTAAAKGKSIMIYGIIALAVMVSIYGLIYWLQGTLGIGGETTIQLPVVPGANL